MNKLPRVLAAPILPSALSSRAQWLSGEGAGSWFDVKKIDEKQFQVKRFSPNGTLECEGVFCCNEPFDINKPFTFTYPSHCRVVSILQEEKKLRFNRI